MLRLEAVSKRYSPGRWILSDVGLEIAPGAAVAITGSNGSGKSTLLRILVGLSPPTRGSVSGRPQVVGYVPDRLPPSDRLSAAAYLTHMGRIRGLSTRQASTKAGQLLDRLALVGGVTAPIRSLSKGNVQKVVLAQALMVWPQLLVLDEPWSGLDGSAHGVLAEIIKEVIDTGGAVVFTDHRESITMTYASRTYAINGGQVTQLVGDLRPDAVAIVDVVLSDQMGRGTRDLDWYAFDGVLGVSFDAEVISVRVVRERCDGLLMTALQNGWSVKSVMVAGRHGERSTVLSRGTE